MPYALKLLRATDKLPGKANEKSKYYAAKGEVSLKDMRERVYMKIIEDLDDTRMVSNSTLKQICYVIEEFN